MKCSIEQLATTLKNKFSPVYLLSGDEPWQRLHAYNLITNTAKTLGYDEKITFHIQTNFDWQVLFDRAQSLSLFASKQLFICHMPSGKPGTQGSAALIEYCAKYTADNCLILLTEKLESAVQKSKWVKAIDNIGVICQVWPLPGNALRHWLETQAQSLNLHLPREAYSLLAERHEGNMLALAQSLEKLSLLYGDKEITLAAIDQMLCDSAHYTIFELSDAALAGNAQKTHTILQGLVQEGTEATLILWALSREIQLLVTLSQPAQPHALPALFNNLGIWQQRQFLYLNALKKHSSRYWLQCLNQAADVDKIVKGVIPGDKTVALSQLALALAGIQLFTPSQGISYA